MANMNIHTTMGAQPRYRKVNISSIKRGATAVLNYNIIYDIESVDQFTLVFCQDSQKYIFTMFDYFELTQDTVAMEGTDYYEKKDSKFILADLEVGTEIEENKYYELIDLPEGTARSEFENWQIDEHFNIVSSSNIRFILTGSETAQFDENNVDDLMQSEYLLQLNTDGIELLNNKDSVIIEQQKDILVLNSIYCDNNAKSKNITSTAVCSDDAVCL